MRDEQDISIRDLGLIGDRKTCAVITASGEFVWYCPKRFDRPAFFSKLIDPEKGGYWSFSLRNKKFLSRKYIERSAILVSKYEGLEVTDFMPMDTDFSGIARMFSEAPVLIKNDIFLKPFYGLGLPELELIGNRIHISRSLVLSASHPLKVRNNHVIFTIPKGEKGWIFLSDLSSKEDISWELLQELKHHTLKKWQKISEQILYDGIYKNKVLDSIRAIQLLTYEENGGIIAAATTSLPEVPGGERNYDYRYVWLRDSAMITSALIRAESNGVEEQKFLSFLCDAKYRNSQKMLLPFYSLDKLVAQPETYLPLSGYLESQPVRIGNDAMDQLQLDANANVLLAAKLIYERFGKEYHWETVEGIADLLAERWMEDDHGIWEEHIKKPFTSSKVIVAKSLEFISDYAETETQKKRWQQAAKDIRKFVRENCLTSEGAYATYPGSNEVDITAALYPVWLYEDPDSPEMKKTIRILEKRHSKGNLYHRTLECFDASKEGVFLAGCFWMAQYYVMCNDLEKAENIIEAALKFNNDLGFFAEEGDVSSGEMLGNFPQTFVHASFIGVVIDLRAARKKLADAAHEV